MKKKASVTVKVVQPKTPKNTAKRKRVRQSNKGGLRPPLQRERNALKRGNSNKIGQSTSSSSSTTPHITHIPERMERVSTVLSTVSFSVDGYNINPGLAGTFPWLSTIARAYELYRFKKLWFEYRTTSGEVISGSNPALGKVVMATNYDVIDAPFIGTSQMENYEGNCNFPPFQKVARHYVDVRGSRLGSVLPYERRYVRTTTLPDGTSNGGAPDPHAYDIGLFQVGTQGMPANGNQVGELWVGYSIDLIKPKVNSGIDSLSFTSRTNRVEGGIDVDDLKVAPGSAMRLKNIASLPGGQGFRCQVECDTAPCRVVTNVNAEHVGGGDFSVLGSLTNLVNAAFADGSFESGYYIPAPSILTDSKGSIMRFMDIEASPFTFDVNLPRPSTGDYSIDALVSIAQSILPNPYLGVFRKPKVRATHDEVQELRDQLDRLKSSLDESVYVKLPQPGATDAPQPASMQKSWLSPRG